jgi:hypothetical protein
MIWLRVVEFRSFLAYYYGEQNQFQINLQLDVNSHITCEDRKSIFYDVRNAAIGASETMRRDPIVIRVSRSQSEYFSGVASGSSR